MCYLKIINTLIGPTENTEMELFDFSDNLFQDAYCFFSKTRWLFGNCAQNTHNFLLGCTSSLRSNTFDVQD